MPPPSLWLRIRNSIGRALRETGQALDRAGVQGRQKALGNRIIGDDPCIFNDHLSRHRHQMPLLNRGYPIVSDDVAYLAPCSTLVGSVRVGPGASIWYGAVLRADYCENGSSFSSYIRNNEPDELLQPWTLDPDRIIDQPQSGPGYGGGGIFIGENSNVQDGCLITARRDHTNIGNGVTIGHLAQIHSSTIQDHCLIGMGSIISEGSTIETEAFVGAGAVVPPNTTIPSGELWVGNPARKLRALTLEERVKLHYQANEYVKVARGQRGVMELGGNLPDSLIEHLMLGGAPTGSESQEETTEGNDENVQEEKEQIKETDRSDLTNR